MASTVAPNDYDETKSKSRSSHRRCCVRNRCSGFFYQFLIFCIICSYSKGFVIVQPKRTSSGILTKGPRPSFLAVSKPSSSDDIVDVEFEKVYGDGSSSSSSRIEDEDQEEEVKSDRKFEEDLSSSMDSLLDLSLNLDPRWKEVRIPFVDNYGPGSYNNERQVIDAKLSFVVELDGIEYGIGVPFDHSCAITLENDNENKVTYMSPDDDDNEEIMEIMAKHLKKYLSEDLALVRTPRILTIVGELDNYTKNWEQELSPIEPMSAEALMDDSDETLDFFRNFMKEELGEKEYEKTIQESKSNQVDFGEDDLMADMMGDEEFMNLFNIPGFGTEKEDTAGMEEILKQVITTEEDEQASFESLNEVILGGGKIGDDGGIHHDGVALKLISFLFMKDSKSYSLVKLLRPFALVGRRIVDPDSADANSIQFELLPPDEEKILIPKLEQVCRADLESAGLSEIFAEQQESL